MRPLRDWILLEPEETSDAGLVLPDQARGDVYKHDAYKVVVTGQECKMVRVGDVVIQEGPARKFEYKRRFYYACREEDICFIVSRVSKKGD